MAALSRESLAHRAVQHPYLAALAAGSLPDLRWALQDFALQYSGYSIGFPRYLSTVISQLDDPEHRKVLLENLSEESGTYSDDDVASLEAIGLQREWFDGVPHPQLFRRFASALGVDLHDLDRRANSEHDEVRIWRELLLQVLSTSPEEAVGALGLGTENIVSAIYRSFLRPLATMEELSMRETVFFWLHTEVDDHHTATLNAIAVSLASRPEGRSGLRTGMLKALQLRASFWDWLYARALDPRNAPAGPAGSTVVG